MSSGAFALLYRAYRADDPDDRHGFLEMVTWSRDGWPRVNGGPGPSVTPAVAR